MPAPRPRPTQQADAWHARLAEPGVLHDLATDLQALLDREPATLQSGLRELFDV